MTASADARDQALSVPGDTARRYLRTTEAQGKGAMTRFREFFMDLADNIDAATSPEEMQEVLLAWGYFQERFQEIMEMKRELDRDFGDAVLEWLKKNDAGAREVEVGEVVWRGAVTKTEKIRGVESRDQLLAEALYRASSLSVAGEFADVEQGVETLAPILSINCFKPGAVQATLGPEAREKYFETRWPERLESGDLPRRLTAANRRFLKGGRSE